jgi:ABC-type antimicrobial peptide transport system ATPase subunit
VQELKRLRIDYIKEEDIWNYFVRNEWKKRNNLTIAEMVGDILNLDNDIIKSYALELLKNENRKINLDESELL